MIQQVKIEVKDIIPASKDVFNHQGIPEEAVIPVHITDIFNNALDIFKAKAKPASIISELTIEEFDTVFYGEGKNAEDVLLKDIYTKSDKLALFALTLGNEISTIINDLTKVNDFALAAMVDSVASVAADKSVEVLENHFFAKLAEEKVGKNGYAVLGYSPGYCGWDISAQRKLFENINPGKIGIILNESFLMTPLKSVTGVLVYGKKEIHIFKSNFSFCRYCKNKTCVERIEKLLTDDYSNSERN